MRQGVSLMTLCLFSLVSFSFTNFLRREKMERHESFLDKDSKTSKFQMSVCVCVCEGERVKIWTSDFSSLG